MCFLAVFIVKCWLGLTQSCAKKWGGGGIEIGGLGEAPAGFQEVR